MWLRCLVLAVMLFPASVSGRSLPEMAEILEDGSWAWPEADEDGSCEANPHIIWFNDDLTEMTFEWAHSIEPVLYRIIYTDDGSITAFLNREWRHNRHGDLVIWQLRLLSANEFCWRRTDWPNHACPSYLQIRCPGMS